MIFLSLLLPFIELELKDFFSTIQVLGAFGVVSCFVIAALLFYLLVSLLSELEIQRENAETFHFASLMSSTLVGELARSELSLSNDFWQQTVSI